MQMRYLQNIGLTLVHENVCLKKPVKNCQAVKILSGALHFFIHKHVTATT